MSCDFLDDEISSRSESSRLRILSMMPCTSGERVAVADREIDTSDVVEEDKSMEEEESARD